MALSSRLNNAVDRAFNAADDLVKTGTLTTNNVSGYNFSTRAVTTTSQSSETVDIILYETKKDKNSNFTYSAIIKSGVDMSSYSTITIDNVVYSINNYNDNNFVIELTLAKEV